MEERLGPHWGCGSGGPPLLYGARSRNPAVLNDSQQLLDKVQVLPTLLLQGTDGEAHLVNQLLAATIEAEHLRAVRHPAALRSSPKSSLRSVHTTNVTDIQRIEVQQSVPQLRERHLLNLNGCRSGQVRPNIG